MLFYVDLSTFAQIKTKTIDFFLKFFAKFFDFSIVNLKLLTLKRQLIVVEFKIIKLSINIDIFKITSNFSKFIA